MRDPVHSASLKQTASLKVFKCPCYCAPQAWWLELIKPDGSSVMGYRLKAPTMGDVQEFINKYAGGISWKIRI